MSGDPVAHEARMRLMDAAGRATAAIDRGRYADARTAAAEADQARIDLCRALGDDESAAYWTWLAPR